MYYYTDENGNIVQTDDFSDLPSEFDIFFDGTVSSGDVESGDVFITYNQVPEFDYDSLYEVLASVPGYTIYPSNQAVSVLTDVLNGIDGKVAYVILSGSDTNDTSLYYSSDFSVSGHNITLFSPVTHCRYYSYRPSVNSSYIYTYTVNSLGDTSFYLTNQLVYTNVIDGYPDVIPFKSKESYSLYFVIALSLVILAVGAFKSFFSRK